MKKIDRMYVNAFTKRRWRNVGDFCNRERHPMFFPYRRYRRGKNRCDYCGAKIGKIKCVYESARDMLVRDVFSSNPMLDMLKEKEGGVVCGGNVKMVVM